MTFRHHGTGFCTVSGMMPTDPALTRLIQAADSLAERAARRRLGDRPAAAQGEVRRILDATLDLMRSNPSGGVRVADVVRAAGVSNDAFYRAFRGKAELVAAVADDSARRLLTDIAGRIGAAGDPAGQVRACVHAVLARAADPDTATVLRHTPRSAGAHLRTGIADLLTDPLTRLGSPRPAADALIAACAVLAVMEHHLWAGRPPSAADADDLLAYLLRS
jgi:AcrR family transcriptional regulator